MRRKIGALSHSLSELRGRNTTPGGAQWRTPEDVRKSHPKASILKGGRVVFNIKANDYRLIAVVRYAYGVLMIRYFGSHEEYDKIDAETI